MLNVLWFVLIGVLFIGYIFLEGFDYGVGMLLPFLGHTDSERRAILATIGPVWDANEVWLITAGGAIFAAFPGWYASLFSGFYMALALLLVSLIVRGVGLEFRSKDARPQWRYFWDWMIFVGGVVPAVVWGIAMANLLRGVSINAHGDFVGSWLSLLNPYALLGGIASMLLLALHGALYLALKTKGVVHRRARQAAFWIGGPATAAYFGFVGMSYFSTHFSVKLGVDPGSIPVLAGMAMVSVRFLLRQGKYGWAFAINGMGIVLSVATVFLFLFPYVLISRLNPLWSLTIYNTASNPYSLKVMTILSLTVLPFVLAYQAWTYWVFRKRISVKDTFHY